MFFATIFVCFYFLTPHFLQAQTNISIPLFFHISPQMHLSEGTFSRWIYNTDLQACAKRCAFSPNERPTSIPCKSFDFYPFEDPRTSPPWNELPLPGGGVCVLHSGNEDTARLRYEDTGLTDAELIYTSHFTHRYASSFYSFIDTRLSFASDPMRITWGFSKQGAQIYKVPAILSRKFDCLANDNATAVVASSKLNTGAYLAGFAPVDFRTGQCPTATDKKQAMLICSTAGANLCSKRDLRVLLRYKLGCGIDGDDGFFPTWASEDLTVLNPTESQSNKYVKCCSQFRVPLNCQNYNKNAIDLCSSLKTEKECQRQGTGFNMQSAYGYGNLMGEFRRGCFRDESTCEAVTVQYWNPRDSCLWCPGSEGGCRPGSDYGICPSSSTNDNPQRQQQRMFFQQAISARCEPQIACSLSKAFPDLAAFLTQPFSTANSEDELRTNSPTAPRNCRIFSNPVQCAQYPDDCTGIIYQKRFTCINLQTTAPTKKKTG